MAKLFKKIFDYTLKELAEGEKLADKVIALESKYLDFTDEQLKEKTFEFKKELENGKNLEEIMVEAFAVVREAAKRVLGLTAYKVQIAGAFILNGGNIAEMKTGEGKTLTSVFSAYLNALTGKGVHIITVNEYLASRDAREMGEVHNFLGITVGMNLHQMSSAEKKEAYNSDIMYSTNSEIGFDYLKDHMVIYKKDMVQRPLNYAIIDEIDSILVDEARTPLIISGGKKSGPSLYKQADLSVKTLRTETDFEIDIKTKSIKLTPEGITHLERGFGITNLYDIDHVSLLHRVNQSLRANFLMENDVEYVVQDGAIVIVDSFTGRMMQGRQFSDGLHQALEAKEDVEVKNETTTMATITYQNFFRMYAKLSGMTGTAKTEEEEFRNIYNMYVVEIPTNRPIVRDDKADLLFATMQGKFSAIAEEIKKRNEKGQPILIGTVSIETSELLSGLLKKHGVKHDLLNAKQHEREADIVLNAGKVGSVTIATNMAGRGTDIKLGEGVIELGGLAVIGTERHESRRIDNQLRGRSGRQGDPGYTRFYLSADDELLRRFGGDRFRGLVNKLSSGSDGEKPVESKMISKSVESAQRRIEGSNFDSRKTVLKYDDVIRKQREVIYEQREEILLNEDIFYIVDTMLKNTFRDLVAKFTDDDNVDYDLLVDDINTKYFNLGEELKVEDLKNQDKLEEYLYNISYQKIIDKKERYEQGLFDEFLKVITLKIVDKHWIEHIDRMSGLRQSISLQAYAQINPLNEYQDIGFQLFETMVSSIARETSKLVLRAEIRQNLEREQVAKGGKEISGKEQETKVPVKSNKVGRNEPCPCGSNKKYKQCCGK